jgi:hypothetical protein
MVSTSSARVLQARRPFVMAHSLPLIPVQAIQGERTSGMSRQAAGTDVEDRASEQSRFPPQFRAIPKAGDVLASRPTARADLYAISIVPAAAHVTARRYSEAMEKVRELARGSRVDGWFTCNHTDYTRVASHRP